MLEPRLMFGRIDAVVSIVGSVLAVVVHLIAFLLLLFQLDVSKQIELFLARFSTGRRDEIVDDDLDNLRGWKFSVVVEGHGGVEERLLASRGLAAAINVELHGQDLLHICGLVALPDLFNHCLE